jgi:endonuclease YncB( thermonuclease family)
VAAAIQAEGARQAAQAAARAAAAAEEQAQGLARLEAQAEAQRQRRGLWQADEIVQPWVWRRQQREATRPSASR